MIWSGLYATIAVGIFMLITIDMLISFIVNIRLESLEYNATAVISLMPSLYRISFLTLLLIMIWLLILSTIMILIVLLMLLFSSVSILYPSMIMNVFVLWILETILVFFIIPHSMYMINLSFYVNLVSRQQRKEFNNGLLEFYLVYFTDLSTTIAFTFPKFWSSVKVLRNFWEILL